jgi:glutamate formiminotransferase
VPFVPLFDTPMTEAVVLARSVGRTIAEHFGVPVYLYEEAAAHPYRRNLEDVRRGGFEGLTAKMATPQWRPDFGPSTPHPTAGATAVGARNLLIAYNINLDTDRLDVAKGVAALIRQRGGGLPSVKALGIALRDQGIVQVTINLTNYRQTSLEQVYEAVSREAAARGVQILQSEFVGLVPAAALPANPVERLRLTGFSERQILENRLRDAGLAVP